MAERHEVKERRITDVSHIVGRVDEVMRSQIGYVDSYAPAVMRELRKFDRVRERAPRKHAQRCLIFALISPQCRFDVNVRALGRMMAHLHDEYPDVESVYQVITVGGTDSWFTAGMAARALFKSLDFIRNVKRTDMNKAALMAAKKAGRLAIGEKTASMAVALYDGNERVWTLDVHMLRGIERLFDGIVAGTMIINDKSYRELESAMVAWHDRTFSDYPRFVSQWALWSAWRSEEHVSHTGILAV